MLIATTNLRSETMYAIHATTHRPLTRPAKIRTIPNPAVFPYGELISPELDRVGGTYDEQHRQQLCINQEMIQLIERLSSKVNYEPWLMGKWVHRRQTSDITRVVTTSFGYRGRHRLDGKYYFLDLGSTLGEVPFLFPTAEIAIKAVELKLSDLDEAWIFKWLR
jgi:hypothetical protein